MAQVLFECMNKDFKNNEMVDAGEFLNSLIEVFFEDKISKSPSKLSRCLGCKHITGIAKQNEIRVMIWLSDRNEKISMQSLL